MLVANKLLFIPASNSHSTAASTVSPCRGISTQGHSAQNDPQASLSHSFPSLLIVKELWEALSLKICQVHESPTQNQIFGGLSVSSHLPLIYLT